jgi:hypothetical protein
MDKCYCPDDCNCRKPWRKSYCGCQAHDDLSDWPQTEDEWAQQQIRDERP